MNLDESNQAEPERPIPPDLTESQTAPKPLLASEVLIDDLAPVEPWHAATRWWAAGIGATFAIFAALPLVGGSPIDSVAFAAHIALVVATVAAGVLPIAYGFRGVAMTMISICCGLLAIGGFGPAAALAESVGEWGAVHLVAAIAVPAALLFRARYRAYGGARRILALAQALSLPFVVYCLVSLNSDHLTVQVTSGLALVAVGLSLLGFMGSEATTTSSYLATLFICAVTAQLGSLTLVGTWPAEITVELASKVGTLIAFAGAAMLGALGVFQLLAVRHWVRARAVDVRKTKKSRPPLPSLGDSWSTRK